MHKIDIHNEATVVEKKFQKFPHPTALNNPDFGLLKSAVVMDYNGGGMNDLVEQRFAEYVGHVHAVSTNSGTSALLSMYYAAEIGPGDEVIVPNYTFFATSTPLFILQARPVLADCDENGNLLPSEISRLRTSRTKAVVVTHMWGTPCEMNEIVDECARNNLMLLEDASHAHGAIYDGRMAGSFGIAAAWSFGAKKLVSGGQGGMMLTSDRKILERAILLGHYNRRGARDVTLYECLPYATTGVGLNLRMHPYAAALINGQLDEFDEVLAERRTSAMTFLNGISDLLDIKRPILSNKVKSSWYAIALRYQPIRNNAPKKSELIAALHTQGALDVDAPNSTCPTAGFQIFQERAEISPESCRNSEIYHHELLKLPSWYGPNAQDYATQYAAAFRRVFSDNGLAG